MIFSAFMQYCNLRLNKYLTLIINGTKKEGYTLDTLFEYLCSYRAYLSS